MTKEVYGTDFGDLGLLGRLIAPEKSVREGTGGAGIEVLDSKDMDVQEGRDEGVEELVEETKKLTLEQEHAIFLEG